VIPLSMVNYPGHNMLTNHNDIKAWLDRMNIEKYTINDTGTVTVDGSVDISDNQLTEIPVQFRIVYGNFSCGNNGLKSLEGSPREVGGDFCCNSNSLESLEGSPQEIGGNFYCWNNSFKTIPNCDTITNGELFWTQYANQP